MLLATRNIAKGDTRRYEIDYREFLDQGIVLSNPVVAIVAAIPAITSTVQNVSLDAAEKKLYFFVTGGPTLNETFTVAVQVQDSNLETVNDTIQFTVVAP
jgi:hypothetical protein